MRRFPWFELILVIAVMAIHLYAAFSDAYDFPNAWFTRDDAYYYFKVAQNISEGRGSTFDGINPTNGYHPLWLLICIPIFALARFDLILPLRVLLLILGGMSAATGVLLYRLIGGAASRPAGMLAALYWVFDRYIQGVYYKTGLETGIAAFFIALLLYYLYRFERSWRVKPPTLRQIAWLSATATLVLFSRLDLVFLSAVIGIWVVFRAAPMRYLLPIDVLIIAASGLIAFVLRVGLPEYYQLSNSALTLVAIGLLIKLPVYYFTGLYQRPAVWKPVQMLKNIILAVSISAFFLSVLLLVGSAANVIFLPRSTLLIDAALTFVLLTTSRAGVFGLRRPYLDLQALPPIEYLRQSWKGWLKEGGVYYGILGGTLALYMVWNKLAFGTFSPVSGQIKRWWGLFPSRTYGGPAKTLLSFIGLDPQSHFNAWEPATTLLDRWYYNIFYKSSFWFSTPNWQVRYLVFTAVFLAILYTILLLRRRKALRSIVQASIIPLLVGSFLQIFSYNSIGYASPKEWYWVTQEILLVTSASLFAEIFFDLLLKKWLATRILLWTLVIVFGTRMTASYYQDIISQMPYHYASPGQPYMNVLPFLETNTEPGAIIGMTGGGNVGYFIHDRTIVNMDGLINSYDYFQAMKNGQGSEYLYQIGMDYVFANPTILNGPPYWSQYTDRASKIATFGGKVLMQLHPKPVVP